MKQTEEKIVLIDEPNLVEYRTDIKGWTGPDKLYYGQGDEGEQRARYANATHKTHDCGNIIKKNSYCPTCSNDDSIKKYKALEEIEWDGTSMMCLRHDDRFFSEIEEVFDYCINDDIELEDLELMHCELRVDIMEINIDEMNDEYTTDGGECGVSHYHPEITKKVVELNKLIRDAEPKLWFQSRKRIKLSNEDLNNYR